MPADEPAIGVRAAYDAVAREYDRQLHGELDRKPLEWFGEPVELDGYFLDPAEVVAELGLSACAETGGARLTEWAACRR